jgi:chloramphenicol-sensitive protein RarD
LIKKQVRASAYTSLTMETLFLLPFALVYLLFFVRTPLSAHSLPVNLLLFGTGFVTVVPLFLFGESTRRISYIAVSFLQYIAPTVNFFIAWFLYREPLSPLKLVGFVLIWISILVYSIGMGLAVRTGKGSISTEEEGKV